MIYSDLKNNKTVNETMDYECESKCFDSHLKPDMTEDEYDLLNFNDENEPYRI